jgi:putative addiction module component (TIGR02574 family)
MSSLATLDIESLTVEQKLDLIGLLWDSIPTNAIPPMTEAQLRELDRRIAKADANPHAGRPWEEVKARLLGGDELPVPDWHLREVKKRIADAEANPGAMIPWEELRAELRGRSYYPGPNEDHSESTRRPHPPTPNPKGEGEPDRLEGG